MAYATLRAGYRDFNFTRGSYFRPMRDALRAAQANVFPVPIILYSDKIRLVLPRLRASTDAARLLFFDAE